MADQVKLPKAKLIELDATFDHAAPDGQEIEVQFNPDSLKVTFANRTQEPKSAGDQRGNSTRQVVGTGSTKLTLQLWFDVTAPGAGDVPDVRALTRRVAYFMLPKKTGEDGNQPVPPGVRFEWGTFRFDGLMDSLDETLDYFSPDGRPLRAGLNVGLSGQIEVVPPGDPNGRAAAGPTPGTRPLAQATAGAALPALIDRAGTGGDWQAVAAANGVENPRLLSAGQLLDLRASVRSEE